jgi:thiamine biosynthesis lipoprotein
LRRPITHHSSSFTFVRRLITHHSSPITFLCLALASCTPVPQQFSAEFLAMGTTVSITALGDESAATRQAINEAQAELQRIGREWYPWASDGELVRLNAALAQGQSVKTAPDLAQLLQRSQDYFRLSGGAFDPAIGGLVRLWGFDSIDNATHLFPTQKQLDLWKKSHPTIADIHIDSDEVSSTRRDVILDLGAIGKGYAVDRAIELLQQRGIQNAMVNAGGNLRALGNNNSRSWRVAIRDPRAVRTLGWLELKDESVSTSGDYERFFLVGGKRMHHLLDPNTGRPADHTIAVTVIASDATVADAASTALFIAGPNAWQSTARKLGIDQVLRIDASGQVQVTAKLHARLQTPSTDSRRSVWTVVD